MERMLEGDCFFEINVSLSGEKKKKIRKKEN
jgi:hypothetical protein